VEDRPGHTGRTDSAPPAVRTEIDRSASRTQVPLQITRALLVEDNPGDAELVRDMLVSARTSTYEVAWVTNLAKGLAALERGGIDVVLLDLSLPDSRGLETFERVYEKAARAPIIVMTGLEDEDLAATAVRQGAQDYLSKRDLRPDTLARAIRYALERQRAAEALRESEERYALAVRGANDGLWDWDLKTDVVYYSPRWKAMLGYRENEIGDSKEEWLGRVHSADRLELEASIRAHLTGDMPHFENEHRILHRDGSYRWVLCRGLAIRNAAGRPCRMAGSQADISDRKRAESDLQYSAFHDVLTGLPNRALFVDRLQHALESGSRHQSRTFAVLFLDLDRFKVVNDSLGHYIGDQLLSAVARRIESCLRPGDTVARLGGDEFAILLEDVDGSAGAIRVAERVQLQFAKPFPLEGHEVFTTGSIGIALSRSGSQRPEDLLRDADTAMYRAKSLGRARYSLFDADMHAYATQVLRIETDLRRALERGEFRIYYQPVISLKDGRIAAFEALLRWEHPERGLLYPADFIAVAEETGLLTDIDRWVVAQACRQLRVWQQSFPRVPPVALSINLSGKQFSRPELTDYMRQVLRETEVETGSVCLEITESTIMEYSESVTKTISGLRDLGVQVCLDDFGTGYSSLSYLCRFPADAVKIDRSFVAHMTSQKNNVEVVKAIVTLAKTLGMDVVAEGVETKEQLAQLVALDCDCAQGYLFAAPLDGQSASLLSLQERWLEK
jgi:diguanylate cyclase (GGDEF)-like protein/PAS domain S-box-containing protein